MVVGGELESSLNEFRRASSGDEYVQKGESFSAIHKIISRLLVDSKLESAMNESGTASRPDTGS